MLTLDRLNPPSESFTIPQVTLKSTIEELSLHHCQIAANCLGAEVAKAFEQDPLLPGVVLVEANQLVGVISRRRFTEKMSRPYGLDLFSKRSIKRLYEFIAIEHLILPGNTSIVEAAQHSLQRSPEFLYEPIGVHLESGHFCLLDVHQLLLAQAKIHELTTQLLEKQTEAKLIQTEKMSALGELVASVAHEINNPVNFIYGNAKYLSNYSEDLIDLLAAYEATTASASEEVVEIKETIDLEYILKDLPRVIDSIKVGADRLKQMIGALRNFSHMDESQRKSSDLHQCLDDALLILHGRFKNHVQIIKQYGDLPLIQCYSGQLSQVFINLIGNAIDALLEVITSESKFNWEPQIQITTEVCANDPEWITIQIADNGPGMPLEVQAHVFETFFTTKPVGKGTGLGLAISRQIVVEKHHGKLNLWSEPGVGTQFEILLPIE